MTDSIMLSEALLDAGITITEISQKLGIERDEFCKKINNEAEFKVSEIAAIQVILNLSDKKRDAIFFTNKVE